MPHSIDTTDDTEEGNEEVSCTVENLMPAHRKQLDEDYKGLSSLTLTFEDLSLTEKSLRMHTVDNIDAEDRGRLDADCIELSRLTTMLEALCLAEERPDVQIDGDLVPWDKKTLDADRESLNVLLRALENLPPTERKGVEGVQVEVSQNKMISAQQAPVAVHDLQGGQDLAEDIVNNSYKTETHSGSSEVREPSNISSHFQENTSVINGTEPAVEDPAKLPENEPLAQDYDAAAEFNNDDDFESEDEGKENNVINVDEDMFSAHEAFAAYNKRLSSPSYHFERREKAGPRDPAMISIAEDHVYELPDQVENAASYCMTGGLQVEGSNSYDVQSYISCFRWPEVFYEVAAQDPAFDVDNAVPEEVDNQLRAHYPTTFEEWDQLPQSAKTQTQRAILACYQNHFTRFQAGSKINNTCKQQPPPHPKIERESSESRGQIQSSLPSEADSTELKSFPPNDLVKKDALDAGVSQNLQKQAEAEESASIGEGNEGDATMASNSGDDHPNLTAPVCVKMSSNDAPEMQIGDTNTDLEMQDTDVDENEDEDSLMSDVSDDEDSDMSDAPPTPLSSYTNFFGQYINQIPSLVKQNLDTSDSMDLDTDQATCCVIIPPSPDFVMA